ncbi:YoaK family small membrane protein [Klebsiella pneumoniae]|nr:YoaK family small membrane protein [Klebsiella pneumoniae]
MRIGIAFPASVFIIAVAFLAWFILGGYATPVTCSPLISTPRC